MLGAIDPLSRRLALMYDTPHGYGWTDALLLAVLIWLGVGARIMRARHKILGPPTQPRRNFCELARIAALTTVIGVAAMIAFGWIFARPPAVMIGLTLILGTAAFVYCWRRTSPPPPGQFYTGDLSLKMLALGLLGLVSIVRVLTVG